MEKGHSTAITIRKLNDIHSKGLLHQDGENEREGKKEKGRGGGRGRGRKRGWDL